MTTFKYKRKLNKMEKDTCLFRRLWASEASAETWFESCPSSEAFR